MESKIQKLQRQLDQAKELIAELQVDNKAMSELCEEMESENAQVRKLKARVILLRERKARDGEE